MNRRTFLKRSAAAVAGVTVAAVSHEQIASAAPASRIVDTHVHFYDPTRTEGVPWPSKGTALYRPVLPRDWAREALPLDVKEVIVVEASSWLDDNAWILELAQREPAIIGFVGHLLPHETDFAKHLKRFAGNRLFRGIRVNHGDFMQHVDAADFRAGIKLMTDLGLELDLNVAPGMLLAVAKLASEIPELRIVLNHVGSAGDAARVTAEWRDGMQRVGEKDSVFCKVSALQEQTKESGTRYGHAPRETSYYTPILEHCWTCFGADRLMYGSNWPVSDVGGSYADQFKLVSDYFTAKGPEACEKYFWKNAKRAYQWLEK